MGRKTIFLLAVMAMLAIPALGDGSITANVSLNGTPNDGAFVGVRTAPSALANPTSGLGNTSGGGIYTTGTLPDGTYYVEAWVNGYIAVETTAVVSGDNPSVNLNITEAVTQNLVQTTGVPADPARYFNSYRGVPEGGNTFVNGAYGSTSNSYEFSPYGLDIGVDLGADHQVNQALVQWYGDGNEWPAYTIDYAVEDPMGIPAIDSSAWVTWASGSATNMNTPINVSGIGWASIVTGPPIEARYWRIRVTTASHLYIGEFELHTTEVYVPPAVPGTIMGVVSAAVDGTPLNNAVIGVKPAPATCATADADDYYVTLGAGNYATEVLPDGDYLVGVWADGYKMSEATVTVSSAEATVKDFSLDAQAPDVAAGKLGFGGVWGYGGGWQPVTGGQDNGGSPTFLDGVRNNGYTVAGDFRVGTGGGPVEAIMGVDLGTDCDVSQVLIDWYFDGAWYYPRGGYKVEYATAAAPTTWTTFYEFTGAAEPKPFGGTEKSYEAISGAPTSARYWRISATDGYGWGSAVYLVQEFEVYSSTTPPPSLKGTVKVNGGVPPTTAVIGVKTTTSATADPFVYIEADAGGEYSSSAMPDGDYYVGVWVDGYKISETPSPVTIVTGTSQTVGFDLTEAQSPNAARNKMGIGGFYYDSTYYPISESQFNIPNGSGWCWAGPNALMDGNRNGNYQLCGDYRTGEGLPELPVWMGVDLGSDKAVSQALIAWDGNGASFMPRSYRVEYATSAAPTTWLPWYSSTVDVPSGYGGGLIEPIKATEATGRYWRIAADTTGTNWGGQPVAFIAQEFEVYSATPDPSIGDFKKQPDGSPVTVVSKVLTVVPSIGGTPVTGIFYIEEPDRSSGIRVQNESFSIPTPDAGAVVVVSGTVETDGASGERYIAAADISSVGTDPIRPVGVNTRSIQQDVLLGGMYVKTAGTVREVAGDLSWFTIADGYTRDGVEVATKVLILGDPLDSGQVYVGAFAKLTGAVSLEGPITSPTRVVILQKYTSPGPILPTPAHSWSCGFEPAEGYSLGTVDTQGGWSIITTPESPGTVTQNGGAATVVASPDPVQGTQSLKLSAIHTDSDDALRDKILIGKLTTEDDLRWMVVKFSVWRTPGNVDDMPATPGWPDPYCLGPGSNPAIQTNYLWWWSKENPYSTGAQWDWDMNTYPFWTNPSPTIAGRFAEVVLYMDFVNQKAWSWYDDQLVDDGITFNPAVSKFSDVEFFYYPYFPNLPGEYGRPAYIDNVSAGWATTSDP